MDDSINKHLHDILDAINEVESFFGDKPKYFGEFCDDLYIIHGYDSLSADILWSIVINHLPKLKEEVQSLLEQ